MYSSIQGEAELVKMSIPLPVISIQKRYQHGFEDSIYPLSIICLGLIDWVRGVYNSHVSTHLFYQPIPKLGTVVSIEDLNSFPARYNQVLGILLDAWAIPWLRPNGLHLPSVPGISAVGRF